VSFSPFLKLRILNAVALRALPFTFGVDESPFSKFFIKMTN